MASLQKTWSGDLTQSIARQLWAARQEAAGAKKQAMGLLEYADDPMLQFGEFMGHAVAKRATSMLPERIPFTNVNLHHQMPDLEGSEYLMRGQSRSFASPISPKPTRSALAAKIAGQPFPHVGVGAPMSAQQPITNKPRVATSNNKAVKVRDEKLGKFVSEVAISLSGGMNILNKRVDAIDEGIIAAKDGLSVTQDQLEDNGSVLENKLDAIISLLRSQKEEMAQMEDAAEVAAVEQPLEKQNKLYGSGDVADFGESVDETIGRDPAGNDFQYNNDLSPMRGEAERGTFVAHGKEMLSNGKVIDGPDTGYLASAEQGSDALGVAPINNFFTRGQTGAASKTNGLPSGKPVTGKEQELEDIPEVKAETEKLQKASILPIQAAGAMTMGVLGKAFSNIPVVGGVADALKTIATPVASLFGVKDVITNNIAQEVSTDQEQKKRAADTASGAPVSRLQEEKKERAWWDFLGWAGTGSGGGTGARSGGTSHRSTIGVRNTRHSNSMGGSRSSSSVRSTTSIGGSSNSKNVTNNKGGLFSTISNFMGLAKDRDHKVSPDTSMGNTINQMQLKRYIMEHGELPPGYGQGGAGAFGGGNLGESAYGGTENRRTTNANISAPGTSRDRFVNLSEKSKESVFTKLEKANESPEPIVINNASSNNGSQPQEVQHISNVGDPGLDIIYPSLV